MSKLKINYEIYGKRYDEEEDLHYWGGNKEYNGGELYDDVNFNAKFGTILSYMNLENEKIINALLPFAESEVNKGIAVDNDFMINLKISDDNTKKIHLDVAFNANYKDGALLPKITFGTIVG